MTQQTAADVRLNANLTENYLYIEDAPVAPGPPGSFVAVRAANEPRSHLLAIDSDGDLLHFAPDKTSASGWRTTKVPVAAPGNAAKVDGSDRIFSTVGFFNGDVLNAVCLFPTATPPGMPQTYAVSWVARTSEGQWSQAAIAPHAAGFAGLVTQADVYTDPSGACYVYGRVPPPLGLEEGSPSYLAPESAVFFILYFDTQNQVWDVYYQRRTGLAPFSTGDAFRAKILNNNDSGQPIILWLDQQQISSAEVTFSPPGQGGLIWETPVSIFTWSQSFAHPITRIVSFPAGTSFYAILVVDASGALSFAAPTAPGVWMTVPLLQNNGPAPAGVVDVEVCALPDEPGWFGLFAIEANTSSLWSARFTLPSATWHNLGNPVLAIAVPESVAGGLELFTVSQSTYAVSHMGRTPDQIWIQQKIASPTASTATPLTVPAISAHPTALDGNGLRIAKANFSVTSDQWINLLVPGNLGMVAWWIGPGSDPAEFTADDTGEATVMFQAQSLSMPKLTFSATAPGYVAGEPVPTRWCKGDVIEIKPAETAYVNKTSVASRLAGKDPRFPVSSDALTSNNLLNPASPDASTAVSSVTSAGQWMLRKIASEGPKPPGAAAPVVAPRSFRLEHTSDGVRCRELTGAEFEAHAAWRAANTHPGALLGGFSSDIGDFVNWAKHAGRALEHVTLTIGHSFEVAFGDLKHFVVDTVRQAGAVMEAYFVHLAMAVEDIVSVIEDLIKWLMLLFEWKDIVNTHKVIRTAINSMLDHFQDGIGDLRGLADREFDNLIAMIQSGKKSAAGNPAFHSSFNDFANSLPGKTKRGYQGNALANPAQHNAFHDHGTVNLFVYRHIKGNPPALGGAAPGGALSSSGTPDFSKFLGLAKGHWQSATVQTKAASLNGLLSEGVAGLLDKGMRDVLGAIDKLFTLALNGAKDVVDALLELFAVVIKELRHMLNVKIEIPIVTWLYKTASGGDKFTILDAFCLAAAVPVTVLYKVFNGGSAPFGSDDYKNLNLTWPPLGPSFPAARPPGDARTVSLEALAFCGGLISIFSGLLAAIADEQAFTANGTPSTGLTVVAWCLNLASLASYVLEAPFAMWSDWSAGDMTENILVTVLWGGQVLVLAYDWISAFTTSLLVRDFPAGPVVDSCCGAILLCLGYATAVVQLTNGGNTWDFLGSLVPQLGRPFRFLILDQGNPTTPFSAAAIGLIDGTIAVASGVIEDVPILDPDFG